MSNPWLTVFKELPNDEQVVWIRVINIYGDPVLAEFDSASVQFVSVTTGIVIEAAQVARWKPQ